MWAIAAGLAERRMLIPARFFGGGLLALVVALPILIPAFRLFLESRRAGALPEGEIGWLNVSFGAQIIGGVVQIGWLMFTRWLGWPFQVGAPFAFSAIGVITLLAICRCRRWRPDQWTVFAVMLVAMLFVDRPAWLEEVLLRLPLFKSLRWPMREMIHVLFFAHLLVILAWSGLGQKTRWIGLSAGALLFVASLCLVPPPAFNPFLFDRYLLLSGRADKIWADLKNRLAIDENTILVPSVPPSAAAALNSPKDAESPERDQMLYAVPHCIACGYNFPALFGVKSATGYNVRGFERSFRGIHPVAWMGYFNEAALPRLRNGPGDLLFVRIARLSPARIEFLHGQRYVSVEFSRDLSVEPAITGGDATPGK